MLCRFSLVIVTVWAALVDPTASLPKLTDEGLTLIFARPTAANASTIVIAAAPFWILFPICLAIPIGSPIAARFSSGSPELNAD